MKLLITVFILLLLMACSKENPLTPEKEIDTLSVDTVVIDSEVETPLPWVWDTSMDSSMIYVDYSNSLNKDYRVPCEILSEDIDDEVHFFVHLCDYSFPSHVVFPYDLRRKTRVIYKSKSLFYFNTSEQSFIHCTDFLLYTAAIESLTIINSHITSIPELPIIGGSLKYMDLSINKNLTDLSIEFCSNLEVLRISDTGIDIYDLMPKLMQLKKLKIYEINNVEFPATWNE